MTRKSQWLKCGGAGICMLFLIVDSSTAFEGAREGVQICLQSVIPSLFPFLILSIFITGTLTGTIIPILSPICKLCRIPSGAESLLLTGLLGGYPSGAQCVSQAYTDGVLSHTDATRMLAFCNNCGPAFLFGITATAFDAAWAPWVLWIIHILSAILTGILTPGGQGGSISIREIKTCSLVESVRKAIKTMSEICGWIIAFRMILSMLNRWCLWLLPKVAQTIVTGFLELSNGCLILNRIPNIGLRFVICSAFIGFGGVCVALQTYSVVNTNLSTMLYFPGKLMQSCISILLSLPILFFYEEDGQYIPALIAITGIILGILAIFLHKTKKSSSIPLLVGV